MLPVFLHDRGLIETFLVRNPQLHLYELGDLDDFFWPYTTWYADHPSQPSALLLLYSGGELPVLLAIADPGGEYDDLCRLVEACLPLLPRSFYSHLSPGIASLLSGIYHLKPHGRYLKMGLTDPARLDGVDTSQVIQFTPADVPELRRFYDTAYPGNWFDPRMLETGCYFGIRREGQIASVAGIHVYSPRYRAAALGNITTHPAWRGQGLGRQVTARLCQHLRGQIDHIGLNVRADNEPALAVYTRLGFTPVAEYEEYMIEVKNGSSFTDI